MRRTPIALSSRPLLLAFLPAVLLVATARAQVPCSGPTDCDDTDPCTVDVCDPVDGCLHAPAVDGTACDDGDVCNGQETCVGGVCTAGTALICDDGDPCTTDACDPVSGCMATAVVDGTACDDGDACNGHETCVGGVCTAGTALICDDGDPCTTDACDPVAGCGATVVADGSACDDGDACNGQETCVGGVCTSGTALVCDDGDPCTTDACDPVSGCMATAVVDGTACDDGDACNGHETCVGGVCTAGTAPVCDDGNPCTVDACNPLAGCIATAVPDGTACADGDVCNGQETCVAGTCSGGTAPVCDDGNPCTVDACDPVAGCTATPRPDGTTCDDGDVCNGVATCIGALCTPGTPPVCDDGNPCTANSCDPQSGCVVALVPDGTSCADGNICNGQETCVAGACTSGVALDCDDANPCTTESCDPVAGCGHTPRPDGTTCDDGDVCNGIAACSGGVCVPGAPAVCDDANPCTVDTCNAVTGCVHSAVADGSSCTDGNPCNGAEACVAGSCTGGTPPACNDGNPCTVDSCDPALGCVHVAVADGTACDDGDRCNGAETCSAGQCTAGTAPVCDDANPCTADGCDPATGCRSVAVPDGTACPDGNLCNGDETCHGGTCTSGTPLVCTDTNPCTVDACDPASGCSHAAVLDGTPCPDANACNGAETCLAGICAAAPPPVCDDANPCTVDSCDPAVGCIHLALLDGLPCSDGNLCNGLETCRNGICTGGTGISCNDNNPCTVDTCDVLGGCTHVSVTDGTSCSDGNPCNGSEICQSGACTPGSAPSCDDGNRCTTDLCDPISGCLHVVLANGVACSDGNTCNGLETCQSGACVAGAATSCDDQNPCTVDGCDVLLGCTHVPVGDGTSCSDGNPCNGTETCQSGGCVGGAALDCNDHNPCTSDFCDTSSGCRHITLQNGTQCPDGDLCNGTETCQSGSCRPGTPLDCTDSSECTVDSCDPLIGCQNVPKPDGTTCSDGNPCNGTETCAGGVCNPGAGGCSDSNPCTIDLCSPVAGCTHTAVAEGTPCSDGDVCNGAETCHGGACTPGTSINCADVLPCTTDACVSSAGRCVHTAVADGTSCSDGNGCNGLEQCVAGLCRAGARPDCDDGNPCTVDACDPVLGCSHTVQADGTSCSDGDPCNGDEICQAATCLAGTPLADGTSCDDGNPCNGDEVCQSAICIRGPGLVCDDHDECTVDSCNRAAGCSHVQVDCDDANPDTVDSCDAASGCRHDSPIPGTRLTLQGDAEHPEFMKIKVLAIGSLDLVAHPIDFGTSDPVLYGGNLQVRIGTTTEHVYDLPAINWAYKGSTGATRVFRYTNLPAGPISHVLVRNGRMLVIGRGPLLDVTPTDADSPVDVVLTLGSTSYCMRFGGKLVFHPDSDLLLGLDAPPPPACAP